MNYRKLHDGPPDNHYAYLPLGPRQSPPPKRPHHAILSALSWAAESAGTSYGAFVIGLTEADQMRIQYEYEKYQRESKKAMEERARVRRIKKGDGVNDTLMDTMPFIITDEDA